ncbi:hypothetical protein AVEN_19899-1 [Araneus ventricosus]|uniref:Uncharacterized protein n=1 Tax=Araneus ventricosus TaxID=182803 RepID=A0A4Y2JAN9_ARAVE|nr:hypothetical protein AVEN_19899-1 [Araneus ventricosus]
MAQSGDVHPKIVPVFSQNGTIISDKRGRPSRGCSVRIRRRLTGLSWCQINHIPVLKHLAYSSDLAPCDFFLGLKNLLEGNDSQVLNKCSDGATGRSDERWLAIRIYISV